MDTNIKDTCQVESCDGFVDKSFMSRVSHLQGHYIWQVLEIIDSLIGS